MQEKHIAVLYFSVKFGIVNQHRDVFEKTQFYLRFNDLLFGRQDVDFDAASNQSSSTDANLNI